MKIKEYVSKKEELVGRISNLVEACENEMGYEFKKWSDTLPVLQKALPEITSIKKIGKNIMISLVGEGWESTWKITPTEVICTDQFEETEEEPVREGNVESQMVFEKGILYVVENGTKVKSKINCIKKDDSLKIYMKKTESEKHIYVGYMEDGRVASFLLLLHWKKS